MITTLPAGQLIDLNPTYGNFLSPELMGIGEPPLTGSARVDMPYSMPVSFAYRSTNSIVNPSASGRSQ